MSVNSSSDSFVQPSFDMNLCVNTRPSIFIFTALVVVYILVVVPFFVFVLCVGYQRWRKQHSGPKAVMTSHSDVFTFNMVAMELLAVLGSFLYISGAYSDQTIVVVVGLIVFSVTSPGQALFHILTCVDRYLAVVRPVTYLGLRQAAGVRIRIISSGCVWLLCFAGLSRELDLQFKTIWNLVLLLLSLSVVSFCSVSVLCVLIRPGPGEVGGNRKQVDQSKQRAFLTIMAILGCLLLKFLSGLIFVVLFASSALAFNDDCIAMVSATWFSLPSSLVLPLLFLHRAGKLPGCSKES